MDQIFQYITNFQLNKVREKGKNIFYVSLCTTLPYIYFSAISQSSSSFYWHISNIWTEFAGQKWRIVAAKQPFRQSSSRYGLPLSGIRRTFHNVLQSNVLLTLIPGAMPLWRLLYYLVLKAFLFWIQRDHTWLCWDFIPSLLILMEVFRFQFYLLRLFFKSIFDIRIKIIL